ncbi:MAG: hypothetical protein F4X82_01260 [Candidatus Spechtbacteria bacterium SB0662_bin_43]|uniref:Uncharacterized protein n=1 Tax=Candidatus Spechtbacteria bacterium SB0662_bin_43 TaxID=2604897 RepID=A0A845DLD5_9BACT|nr:hypothetical protein [Candidatus Spechtbacteria bacterium SB0662_bin_43]
MNKNKFDTKDNDVEKLQDIVVIPVIDTIVSTIPFLNIAWNIAKANHNYTLHRRTHRAIEFIENIQNHPENFIGDILETEAFQDCFVIAINKYILERNETKRKYMCSIFNNGVKHKYDPSFELEKMYNVIAILNSNDIEILKKIDMNNKESVAICDDGLDPTNENLSQLASVGILLIDTSSRWTGEGGSPIYFKPTKFGKRFVKYLEFYDGNSKN